MVALVRPASRARLPSGAKAVFGTLPDVSPISAFPRPDVVFHCAAVIDGTSAECRNVNVEATARLAEAAGTARFVYVSTTDVYPIQSASPVSEATPERPRSVYGKTKLEGERRLRALRPDAVVLRSPGIYGPRSERCLVSHTARRIERGTFFHVGDGSAVHSWIFVENLVSALLYVSENESLSDAFLVDDGGSISRARMSDEIARAMGRSVTGSPTIPGTVALALGLILERLLPPFGQMPPLTSEGVRYALASLPLDTSRLRNAGFTPPFTMAEGIERTLTWARSAGRLSP